MTLRTPVEALWAEAPVDAYLIRGASIVPAHHVRRIRLLAEGSSAMARFSRFRDFYPYYLDEHSDPGCRRLHVAGTALAPLTIEHIAFRRWIPFALLLSLGLAGTAEAQRVELLAGAGATFSGPSLGNETPNLMAGGVVRVAPRFAVRGDMLYTVDEEEDLVGVNSDGVLSLTPPASPFRPYLMAGAGVFVSGGGDAEFALNGGLGFRVAATRTVGFLVEGRYFRFPAVNSLYDEMIFTAAGLSVALR